MPRMRAHSDRAGKLREKVGYGKEKERERGVSLALFTCEQNAAIAPLIRVIPESKYAETPRRREKRWLHDRARTLTVKARQKETRTFLRTLQDDRESNVVGPCALQRRQTARVRGGEAVTEGGEKETCREFSEEERRLLLSEFPSRITPHR